MRSSPTTTRVGLSSTRARSRVTFARENRSRRNLHGNEEESKKEETLTVGETILAYATNFTGLLREAPLKRLFLLLQVGPSVG
jgi:hypothetical protein